MSEKPNLPPRFIPEKPFPHYAYVPGKFPHPYRDPGGPNCARKHPAVAAPAAAGWQYCREYLWGIDLFNHGYYWEAHEAWETLWHAAGRRGVMADFCKGLIAFAAAGVKAREGRVGGVKQHGLRAHALLASVAAWSSSEPSHGPDGPVFMGLNLQLLMNEARVLAECPEQAVNTSDESVVIVMPFALQVGT